MFVPVQTLAPSGTAVTPVDERSRSAPALAPRSVGAPGLIEIDLGGGRQVRLGSDGNLAALRRVLAALREWSLSPAACGSGPACRPFPEHLPRERVIVPGPVACACCSGTRLSKLGEDVTETLEVVPRQWKVVQHVREKFSCRDGERISQPPAPFHVTPRGWAGLNLPAMLLFENFGQHQPLNRQAERYTREGVPFSLSTLADQVGACTTALMPLFGKRCVGDI